MTMKLLLITQAIDLDDRVLGFFHRWVEAFSTYFEEITVICLRKGRMSLPNNVKVLSLGKEECENRWQYLVCFFNFIWFRHLSYDTVFVHMNEEYVLLAGWWWRLMGKRILLWRNHPSGSWKTSLAVKIAHVVFCTSAQSYTAKFSKTVRMPVGVQLPEDSARTSHRLTNSFLSLGRISPVKHVDLIVEAFATASLSEASLAVVGDPIAREIDQTYAKQVGSQVQRYLDQGKEIQQHPGVPAEEVGAWFGRYEFFVNATEPGSFDKTILEAAAMGCIPLVSQDIFAGTESAFLAEQLVFSYQDALDLSRKMQMLTSLTFEERLRIREQLRRFIEQHHSLDLLCAKLASYV